ncbi:M28 family peptidase [bacterium]|nr:M28 family peptidase [bacterium]
MPLSDSTNSTNARQANLRAALLSLAALIVLIPGAALDEQDAQRQARLREVVEYLSSEECGGRRVGTEGCELAAVFLEQRMAGLGLVPLPGLDGYRHEFPVTRGIRVSGTPTVELNGELLTRGADYIVAPFSGSGSAEAAPLIFAGYGITAPELGWNDYEGIDTEGAAVIIVRGEPQQDDPASAFAGEQPTVYSDLRRKAALARDRGAAALIVLENPLHGGADELPEFRPTYSAANFELPVIHLLWESIDALISEAAGFTLKEVLGAIDSHFTPASMPLGSATLAIDLAVVKDTVPGYNLVGVVQGSSPDAAGEYVVVGAHYDHLGTGGSESMTPGKYGEVHHGADDNASGVAAVLEIARSAMEHRGGIGRSLLVILFSGEELGVVGSSAFVDNAPVVHEQITAMLNLDMVGRLVDGQLILGGTGTALEFEQIIGDKPSLYQLRISEDRSGFGASDHISFTRHDHPVLFFFTGAHKDYHKPSDTAEKINYDGLARVVDFATAITAELLSYPGALTFQEVESPTRAGGSPGPLKVTMGTIPSYIDHGQPGMHISDVRPGGPAERAGIRGGDAIVEIDGRAIHDIYDFMYALEDAVPGQTVSVVVVRDGVELTFVVTLAARNIQQ